MGNSYGTFNTIAKITFSKTGNLKHAKSDLKQH